MGAIVLERTYVIAEIGVNHNGSMDTAIELIDTARRIGADAAKFQHFSPASLVTDDAEKAAYQVANDGDSSQAEMLARLALSDTQMERLFHHCGERGIDFLCTPFDLDSLAFLTKLGVNALKIGSGDLTYDRLLRDAAASSLPLIVSTGMSTLEEVAHAVETVRAAAPCPAPTNAGDFPALTLLHCTSAYPTPDEAINLAAIGLLRERFDLPVGYSDHTQSTDVPAAAVAAGATMIEKHLTLNRDAEGPDHKASLEPDDFRHMVERIRHTSRWLGRREKQPQDIELDTRRVARRSLHYARDLPADTLIGPDDLIALRPGTGIAPSAEADVVGARTTRACARRTPVRMEDIAKP